MYIGGCPHCEGCGHTYVHQDFSFMGRFEFVEIAWYLAFLWRGSHPMWEGVDARMHINYVHTDFSFKGRIEFIGIAWYLALCTLVKENVVLLSHLIFESSKFTRSNSRETFICYSFWENMYLIKHMIRSICSKAI